MKNNKSKNKGFLFKAGYSQGVAAITCILSEPKVDRGLGERGISKLSLEAANDGEAVGR